jgi:hypothetical protein
VIGGKVLPEVIQQGRPAMDELRRLAQAYLPFYHMYDDPGWRQGAAVDHRIRELVKKLRAEGHGPEIEALAAEHPDLISCPGGVHALV